MSLPPGFLDELKSRLSISQVVGRKVTWDRKKSQTGKGDLWAPCPFHHEKSSSFHVIDSKGFYKCFGCQASGDIIKFVQETENVGFMEAIEVLAAEAGMQMPDPDPQARARSEKQAGLVEIMEEAVGFYRIALAGKAGQMARGYLDKRGLSQATRDRFELGYAPGGNSALWAHLTGKGIAPDKIIEAGLARTSDRGGAPYDAFRDRIMFPIRDGRGRCIAFGGRAMDPQAKAKYINSSETPLFDKGANLYNVGPARAAAGKGAPLIVAEGYMDVIALSDAGFDGAVAPLGTAVTDRQLLMLWRMAAEPVFAMDGDRAGQKAAQRVVDLALPMLEAGRSLRFAMMPEGKDPDDLLRAGGREAVQEVLGAAKPMIDILWAREIEGQVYDSPDRRATLDKRLGEVLHLIKDRMVRTHYAAEVKRLRDALFGYSAQGGQGLDLGATFDLGDAPRDTGGYDSGQDAGYSRGYDEGGYDDRRGRGYGDGRDARFDGGYDGGYQGGYDGASGGSSGRKGGGGYGAGYGGGAQVFRGDDRRGAEGFGSQAYGDKGFGKKGRGEWQKRGAPLGPVETTRQSDLVREGTQDMQLCVVLATLATHPALIPSHLTLLERMEPEQQDLSRLRDALLRLPDGAGPMDVDAALQQASLGHVLAQIMNRPVLRITPCLRTPGDIDMARLTIAEAAGRMNADHGWAREVAEAERDMDGLVDEGLTWRLREAAEARARASSHLAEDAVEMEVASNGLELDRRERQAARALWDLIATQSGKGKKRGG